MISLAHHNSIIGGFVAVHDGQDGFFPLLECATDKDSSLDQYLEALKQYWLLYYVIREKTLYDFSTGEKISMSFKDLLRTVE